MGLRHSRGSVGRQDHWALLLRVVRKERRRIGKAATEKNEKKKPCKYRLENGFAYKLLHIIEWRVRLVLHGSLRHMNTTNGL